jgi:outer membrane receptor for ferrienterochelin and colicin
VNWLNVAPRSYGYPTIKVTGYSQVGDADNLPLETRSGIWQVHEGVSVQRGAHALRFGGEIRRIATDKLPRLFRRGSLSVFRRAVGLSHRRSAAWPAVLRDCNRNYDNRQSLRTSAYNLFAQDDWRITPHLNLSFGLRYEYNTAAGRTLTTACNI